MDTVANEKQYIVVRLGSEQYGIDIQYVDNIVRNQRITRVPKAQHYFKGVINLRGEVIPVMSLRLKFDLEPDEYTNAAVTVCSAFMPASASPAVMPSATHKSTPRSSAPGIPTPMAFLNRYASSRAVTCVTVPCAALRAVAALRAIAAGSVQPVEGASEALIIRRHCVSSIR